MVGVLVWARAYGIFVRKRRAMLGVFVILGNLLQAERHVSGVGVIGDSVVYLFV